MHAGGHDHGPGLATGTGRPGEDQVPGLQQGHAGIGPPGRTGHRDGLPGQGGGVDLESARQDPPVGGDLVALLDQQHVSGHDLRRLDRHRFPVTQYHSPGGRVGLQCLDRPLGLQLLNEREDRVEDDDDQDRDGHRDNASQPGEPGRRPQQERERVGELPAQLTPDMAATPSAQLIRPPPPWHVS